MDVVSNKEEGFYLRFSLAVTSFIHPPRLSTPPPMYPLLFPLHLKKKKRYVRLFRERLDELKRVRSDRNLPS